MADIRGEARKILAVVPEKGQIASNGSTAITFTKLTGITQKMMEDDWEDRKVNKKPGALTACNGFVGWYARTLRATVAGTKAPADYLGGFELEAIITKIGMGHAWVKCTQDARPKYGDIYRHAIHYHVGVALDFDGDIWKHVDAGQGGPKTGYDILKQTRDDKPYDFKDLKGWIDIEVYYGTSPQKGPIPAWLAGWWKVTWRGATYYYYFFNPDRKVQWVQSPVSNVTLPPAAADDTGTFAVDGPIVTTRWTTGTVEIFNQGTAANQMAGTWRGSEPIASEKM
jgi:hypothetical protein